MKKLLLICYLFLCISASAQSNYVKFKNLSSPKKWWVIWHPFKAKKALAISKEARKIADSIKNINLLDGDPSGGQVDAFRHSFWMARLHQEIGKSAAKSLGKAHEKENKLMFKKLQLEEGIVPDKISSEMDLFNNNIGLSLTNKGSKISQKELILLVVKTIKEGKTKIIKKDKRGNFLTCKGEKISTQSLKGKWENNKCLIFSNQN